MVPYPNQEPTAPCKLPIALACLALAALAPAQAQNATLYGIVDLGVVKLSRAATQLTANKSSRLGVRGQEDLGGGLRASFQLESEVLADTGASDSTYWGRQAWVGLGGEWGLLRMGRTKNPTDDIADEIDPFTTDGIVGDMTKTAWRAGVIGSRISNSLAYTSPKVLGWRLQAHTVFDELAGAGKQGWGVVATYEGSDVGAVLGYQRPAVTTVGRPQANVLAGGAWMKFGNVKLSAGLSDGDSKRAAVGDFRGLLLGADYESGSKVFKFVFAKLRNGVGGVTNTTVDGLGLGYDYKLSKRTKFYANLMHEKAADVNGVQAGVTHRF